MTSPQPAFNDGKKHFAGRGEEFLNFYSDTAVGRIYVEILRRRIREIIPLGQTSEILDLGGGIGYITVPFASEGHRITLHDREQTMLDTAGEILGELGVLDNYTIVQGEMEHLPYFDENQFDVVMSFSALECCEHHSSAINEMVRVCKPGGSILIVATNYFRALKETSARCDLADTKSLIEEGLCISIQNNEAMRMRAFRADELWGLLSTAGADVEYIKCNRILSAILSEERIEKLVKEWGFDECLNLELTLSDDPALAGAGLDLCVCAKKR
jgi:ubiquinone/menaquinone biosynthesis C-methylase UbiE